MTIARQRADEVRRDEGHEHAELRRRPQQEGDGVGDERPEVRHGPNAQENQRRVHTLQHAEIEVVQHGTVFVDAHLQTVGEGDVAQDDTKADGDQQQWLVFLDDTQGDEYETEHNHNQVPIPAVAKS